MSLFTPVIDVPHTPYCGATAIAALTGVPISRIEKMIRRCRKGYRDTRGRKRPIKGTYTWEVIKVLKRLGCKISKVPVFENTFGKFCTDTAHINATYLVEVTGHFMTTFQNMFCDTASLNGPLPITECKKPSRRVRKVWRVDSPDAPLFTIDDPIKTTRAPKPKRDIKEVRAEKLAAQIKVWEAKERRAVNALKKLRPKLARYARAGIAPAATS